MLLKIYTNQNSIKIISDIEDAEIHNAKWRFENQTQLQNCTAFGPGPFTETGDTPYEVECYDKYAYTGPEAPEEEIIGSSCIKLVDYKKSGHWHRVAIVGLAYLCNDDGKTVAKIGV